jgi:hypothetical protein
MLFKSLCNTQYLLVNISSWNENDVYAQHGYL